VNKRINELSIEIFTIGITTLISFLNEGKVTGISIINGATNILEATKLLAK
jgi:hypothetical protein